MKKYLFIIIGLILFLAACGTNSIYDKEDSEPKNDEPETEVENGPEEKAEEKFDQTIESDDKLLFREFNITMEKIKLYEKEDKYYADISFRWLNHTGDEAKLFQATSIDVEQGENILNEINNAWADKSSDVYFPNANNGEWKIDLTYELVNKDDSVEVTFVPMDWDEDNQTVTIEIN